MRALTLSLYSFFLNWRPLCLSLSLSFLPYLILSQKRPTQITSSLGPFFTGRSFLHRLPRSFLSKNYQPRSLLHRVLSSPADPDPFFIGRSTNQAPATQILSSPADPRTKLDDPDPFFTGRSTNQAQQPRSFLHPPIHEPSSGDPYPFFTGDPYLSVGFSVWVCLCVGVFLCWFICVDVFVCIWGKQDEELRLLCTEKREKN